MKIQFWHVVALAAVAGAGACLVTPHAVDAEPQVSVNGSIVDIAPAPIVQDGRIFVPLRGVFEQLGASVVYSNGTIDATGNGRDISLQIGSTQATVNGQPQTIDVAPFIVGASTYVPLRFISEALGDSVSWDDADNIAAIDTGGGSATYFSPGTASYVDTAPPPLPDYEQPYVPEPNYIWQPGYWAWGSNGYYWVPGAWVEAPQPGYLWTPGYWQWNNYGYVWNPGYWASSVGFYGGVNYGGGYYGNGYDGGRWSNNVFQYNTYVSRVNLNVVHVNVYVDRSVAAHAGAARISYNGGHGGLQARPTPQQVAVGKARHLGMTVAQRQHVQAAEKDRRLVATVNHNKPPVLAVARPLSPAKPATGFVPVKAADRVDPLANVSAVRVTGARSARPAARPVAAARPAAAPAAQTPAIDRRAVAPVTRAAPQAPLVRTAPEAAARPPVTRVAPAPPAAAAHAPPAAAPQPARVAPAAAAPPVHVPAVHAAPPMRPAAVARPAPVRAAPAPAAPPPHAAAPPHPAAPAQPAPKDQKPPR